MTAPELSSVFEGLKTEVANLKDQIKELKQAQDRQRDKFDELRDENTVTKNDLKNHVKQYEKSDARWWTTIGFFIAGVIALLGALIRDWVRK